MWDSPGLSGWRPGSGTDDLGLGFPWAVFAQAGQTYLNYRGARKSQDLQIEMQRLQLEEQYRKAQRTENVQTGITGLTKYLPAVGLGAIVLFAVTTRRSIPPPQGTRRAPRRARRRAPRRRQ